MRHEDTKSKSICQQFPFDYNSTKKWWQITLGNNLKVIYVARPIDSKCLSICWRSNAQVTNVRQAISILRFYLHKLTLSHSITIFNKSHQTQKHRMPLSIYDCRCKTAKTFVNSILHLIVSWDMELRANNVVKRLALLCKWIIRSERVLKSS